MKNWSTYIFLLVAGALSLLATSCSQEDEGLESVIASQGKATVQFSIALGNSGAGSRAATWGESYTPDGSNIGNEFENTIDLTKFHVSLTLADGTLVPIKSISPVAKQETDPKNIYDFVGEVEVKSVKSLTGAKIEVRANIGQSVSTFSTSYIEDKEYPDKLYYPGKGVEFIPMWGIHTVTAEENLLLVPGPASDPIRFTNPIYLLRSMAKVEVVFQSTVNADYKIISAGLSKYKSEGNLLPAGTFTNTLSYNREDCINPSSSTTIVAPSDALGLPFEVAADKRSCVIYVPEYAIQYDQNGKSDLNIQLLIDTDKDGDSDSHELVSQGIFSVNTNLVRNHWYVYRVNNVTIEDDVQFTLHYQVIDWTEIDNGTLTFGDGSGATHTFPSNKG